MDDMPQLVGRHCAHCNRTISSIAEGEFCAHCYNPVHNKCKPAPDQTVASDRCPSCGADPDSDLAREIQAEVKEDRAQGYLKLECPACGATGGFRPYGNQMEETAAGGLLILSLCGFIFIGIFQLILALVLGLGRLGSQGTFECLRCGHVFEAPGRANAFGCIVLPHVWWISIHLAYPLFGGARFFRGRRWPPGRRSQKA